jgi:hypothetical protein
VSAELSEESRGATCCELRTVETRVLRILAGVMGDGALFALISWSGIAVGFFGRRPFPFAFILQACFQNSIQMRREKKTCPTRFRKTVTRGVKTALVKYCSNFTSIDQTQLPFCQWQSTLQKKCDDFSRLLFLNMLTMKHLLWLMNYQRYRINFTSFETCLVNMKGSDGLILVKTSDMRISTF